MEIERWEPWRELAALHQEVNSLFDRFFNRVSQRQTARSINFAPPVDIYETETEIVVRVALPGVIEEDIDVELKGDTLICYGPEKAIRNLSQRLKGKRGDKQHKDAIEEEKIRKERELKELEEK